MSAWTYRAYTQRASFGWSCTIESSAGSGLWGRCAERHFWTERSAFAWGVKQLAKKRAEEALRQSPKNYLEPTQGGECR